MRLNLGCGSDVREGYINVDLHKTHPRVIEDDLSQLPWAFESDSADEILMLDFLEHFPYALTETILLECYRVLRPGGILVIQVPDAEQLTHALSKSGSYLCNNDPTDMTGKTFCLGCGQSADSIAEAAMRRLFGGQDYVGNFHQTCFTRDSLKLKASRCGLDFVQELEHDHQRANWNIKMTFIKGDIW